MPRVFLYSPHPDDETLSMGLAILHYIANAWDVHLVSVTNGSAIGVANTLNGSSEAGVPVACSIGDHPYIHNPVREGYPLVAPATRLTEADIGVLRVEEARSALAMMAMVPKITPGVEGPVTHHNENLPGDFASSGGGSTSPPTQAGIDTAKAIIKNYVDAYPNSFHHTMSETDDHHDHAALGIALRQLKNDTTNTVPWDPTRTYANALSGSRFFVSRLYWATSQPDLKYPADVASMPGLEWFLYFGAKYNDYCNWMRNQVVPVYRAWNPAAGAYGIGYHQVPAQFNANFGPGVSMGNLWHS